MATLGNIIIRVQQLLSVAAGLSAQTYGQPKIVQYVQMAYEDLFNRRFWDDYTTSSVFTLNGTTGKTVEDLSSLIKSFKDIEYIWYENYNNPLGRAPTNRSNNLIRMASFVPDADAACPFIILPVDLAGTIRVRYRTKDALPYSENSEVNMHEELIVRAAALMYVTFDGANPGAIQSLSNSYSSMLATLERLEGQHSKSLYSYDNPSVDRWHDA